jgi:hypothetical protein
MVVDTKLPCPSVEPWIEKNVKSMFKSATVDRMKVMRSSFLEKEEYEKRIKLLENKLSNLKLHDESREEINRSLGFLTVNDKTGRKIAQTYDDRVKLFETDIDAKNKQAEDFVKKM